MMKGQFSILPTDSAVEVDGGKAIGNRNKFPWGTYGEAGKCEIDEVNMLRGDVSQRAAREIVRIAHGLEQVMGMWEPDEPREMIFVLEDLADGCDDMRKESGMRKKGKEGNELEMWEGFEKEWGKAGKDLRGLVEKLHRRFGMN